MDFLNVLITILTLIPVLVLGMMIGVSKPEYTNGFLNGFTLGLWNRE